MSLIVHTARMGYTGVDWLDITRKGNDDTAVPGGHRGMGEAFAPSRRLLNTYLQKRTPEGLSDRDWLDYGDKYTAEMRRSYVAHRASWDKLLTFNHVVLLCFCTDPTQCHRSILAREILTKLGAHYLGEMPT